jgi:hypothetical protein
MSALGSRVGGSQGTSSLEPRYIVRHPALQTRGFSRRQSSGSGKKMTINRNVLFLIIGALVVTASVLGYNLYQEKKQPDGVQINVGPNGLKIQGK